MEDLEVGDRHRERLRPWKTADFADAYCHLDVGLGAAINDHFELKVALIDEYKRKPPDPAVKRNDVAGIVSIGYKL